MTRIPLAEQMRPTSLDEVDRSGPRNWQGWFTKTYRKKQRPCKP
jgi:hypothetical protein